MVIVQSRITGNVKDCTISLVAQEIMLQKAMTSYPLPSPPLLPALFYNKWKLERKIGTKYEVADVYLGHLL